MCSSDLPALGAQRDVEELALGAELVDAPQQVEGVGRVEEGQRGRLSLEDRLLHHSSSGEISLSQGSEDWGSGDG